MDNFQSTRWKKRLAAALAILVFAGGVVGISVRVVSAQFDTFLEVTRLLLGDGDCEFITGTGDPEGVVTGDPCDIFFRTDGGVGTIINVKETGVASNTGWQAAGGTIGGTGTGGTMTRFLSASVIENASMTDAEVVTGDTTDVFTNKSYDVEGTGNVFTHVEKWNIWMGGCSGGSPVSQGWDFETGDKPTPRCTNGTNINTYVLDFQDDTTDDIAQYKWHLPTDFTGTIDAHITWLTSATTGNVVWELSSICVAVGETGDPAFNTASTVTDAANGLASSYNEADISPLTITGCSAGDTIHLMMLRNGANVSDTIGATASLVEVELTVRRAI